LEIQKMREAEEDALYKLVFSRSFRNFVCAYGRKGNAVADVLPDSMNARHLDLEEVERFAQMIRHKVLNNGGVGALDLAATFARSFSFLKSAGHDQSGVLDSFIESKEFAECIDLEPFGSGLCYEESLFNHLSHRYRSAFATEDSWMILNHEFLRAVMRQVTVAKNPFFHIRHPLVRKAGDGYMALQLITNSAWAEVNNSRVEEVEVGQRTILYFGGPRSVVGPISDEAAELLRCGETLVHLTKSRRLHVLKQMFADAAEVERFSALGVL
jgi:hypothetical protein